MTAYIVSELFRIQNIKTVCVPVNLRETENLFGNYVGRIDISRKNIEGEQNSTSAINRQIRRILENKNEIEKGEQILNLIHPGFYDDVIFSVYSNEANAFAKKMSNFIGYKNENAITFLSNLKTIDFACSSNLKVSNLSFYPPHPIERCATIGIVTQDDQMIITIQKFRKG